MMCWSKVDRESGDTILVICSLDPLNVQWGNTALDMPELGLDWNDRFRVVDRVTGAEYDWGQFNPVKLDPHEQPAHLFTLHKY